MMKPLPSGFQLYRTEEGARVNATAGASRVVLARMIYHLAAVPGVKTAIPDELGIRVWIPATGPDRDAVVIAMEAALEVLHAEIKAAEGPFDIPLTLAPVDSEAGDWWAITHETALDPALLLQLHHLLGMGEDIPLLSDDRRTVTVRIPSGSGSWEHVLDQVRQLLVMHGQPLADVTIEGGTITVRFRDWPTPEQLAELFRRVVGATGVGSVSGGFHGFTVTTANRHFHLSDVAANAAAALAPVPRPQPVVEADAVSVIVFPAGPRHWSVQTNILCTPAMLASVDQALEAPRGSSVREANGYNLRVQAPLGRWNQASVHGRVAMVLEACYVGR